MRNRSETLSLAFVVVATLAAAAPASAAPEAVLDTSLIEQLTGAKGQLDAREGVFKVSVPRTDLQVTVAGAHMTPPMGLTSWAAFRGTPGNAMVMGDLVLAEDQVNPVMSVALDGGLAVTALHNHFLWDSPRIMFMHIGGRGDEKTLASTVGKVFETMKATAGGKGATPSGSFDPARTSLDPAKIDAALGVKGTLAQGVYKVVLGRATRMDGDEVGNAMGVNTWAAFVGSDDRAVVDGDFAMLEPELQPVLQALRGAGIDVVAIHQHMVGEQPRIVFLHYWGVGSTQALARGLRAALARTATPRETR
jgi:Domain of Unknown Function (DUF1259)